MIEKLKIISLAFSVERRAYSKKLSAIRYSLSAIICISCFLFLVSFCFAQSLSSAQLINNTRQYDGQTVSYQGEAIGDVMLRDENGWVNINDGTNAIGIWAPKDLLREINFTGSFKSAGDIVEIEGIFHRACLEHGGDLDIHALSFRKVKNGQPVTEKTDKFKKNLVFGLWGALCLILILTRLKRK